MKIAIVTAHYSVGRGYMENVWADVLARTGHAVTVLTGPMASVGLSHDEDHPADAVDIKRFPCRKLPSGIRLEGPGLLEELDRMEPDVVLWINVGSHFGKRLLEHKRRRGSQCKLVCFFGENSGQHGFLSNGRPMSLYDRCKTLGWRLLRGPLYREAVRTCDLPVGITAETPAIISSLFPARQREQVRDRFLALPLGYDGSVFSHDETLRRRTRQELGLGEGEVALMVSSRMTRRKVRRVVRPLVREVAACVGRRPAHRAVIVGFGGSAASRRFRDEIAAFDVADKLILHPLAGRPRLNALFNACDLAVFASPSISVQEAMGTGLYVLVGDDGSMGHLIHSKDEGSFFRRGDPRSLRAGITRALGRLREGPPRSERRAANAWLDYHRLSLELFAALCGAEEGSRTGSRAAQQADAVGIPPLARTLH